MIFQGLLLQLKGDVRHTKSLWWEDQKTMRFPIITEIRGHGQGPEKGIDQITTVAQFREEATRKYNLKQGACMGTCSWGMSLCPMLHACSCASQACGLGCCHAVDCARACGRPQRQVHAVHALGMWAHLHKALQQSPGLNRQAASLYFSPATQVHGLYPWGEASSCISATSLVGFCDRPDANA